MNREHWYHFKPDTLFYIFYGGYFRRLTTDDYVYPGGGVNANGEGWGEQRRVWSWSDTHPVAALQVVTLTLTLTLTLCLTLIVILVMLRSLARCARGREPGARGRRALEKGLDVS